jgi:hypothetical protein
MDDKDRVFANFKDDRTDAPNRREVLTIPRRAGASGSRAVEVVRVRSGGAVRDRPQRVDTHVRAASWEEGFRAKAPLGAPALLEPAPTAQSPLPPTAHLMPAWESSARVADAAPPASLHAPPRRGPGRPRKHPASEPAGSGGAAFAPATESHSSVAQRRNLAAIGPIRRVADPFDASDDGANCMRCGYTIEPAREKRGLVTCLACG